jgi:hypothetical protein
MRVGVGTRDVPPGLEVEGASETTLHAPIIPDDQFLSFQSSPHNKRDWAELFLSIGNSWASGTVSIQGYNFAEAAYGSRSKPVRSRTSTARRAATTQASTTPIFSVGLTTPATPSTSTLT